MTSARRAKHAFCVLLGLIGILSLACFTSSEWRLVTSESHPHSTAVLSLAFTDANHGRALTPFQLLETSDGGQTWIERFNSVPPKMAFYSSAFTSSTTGFIVGAQEKDNEYTALILRTTDGGKSWQEGSLNVIPVKDIHTSHGLKSIAFCNSSVGWAAGSNLIVRTSDGGQTWETQRSGNKEEDIFDIACLTPDRAWAVGQGGLILWTVDGGRTWNRQEGRTTGSLARVRFFGGEGWIVGGSPEKSVLLRSHDGGATWQLQPNGVHGPLFDINFNGTQGWIVGAAGTILHTKDAGQSWEQQESPTTNDLTCLFFLSQRQGWAGGDKKTLLRFSD